MPENKNLHSVMYSTPIATLPYIIAGFLLWLEYSNSNFIYLRISIAIFMIWDFIYYFETNTTVGRDAESVNNSTHTARQQISYFLPFYGIIFGFFFTLAQSKQEAFIKICTDAGIPIYYLVLPFFISCIGMLFMPVQISKSDETPSNAQKAILALTGFAQQSVILILAHTVVRLLNQLSETSTIFNF